MNYHKITKNDMLNGQGIRTVLWVSGCSHNCIHCHNPQTHDVNSGILFDNSAMKELINSLKYDYVKGITFSGGDPLHINNRQAIAEISSKIKELYPNKDQWLYTGYTLEEILSSKEMTECIKNIDVLIDGRFEINKRDISLKWRGSSNQRIIDVQRSFEKGKIILYDE